MNWSDERYIRVYTRDTPDWVALPWESRALFPLLLRKVDRLGTLDLGRHGARGLAPLVGLPLDVTSAGLDGLLADGCATLTGTVLSVPNFVAAQETTASDAKRSKDYRDRLKTEASRTVSQPSRDNTNRHAASRADGIVTPSVLSVPSVPSVPSSTSPSDADAPPDMFSEKPADAHALADAMNAATPPAKQPTLCPHGRSLDDRCVQCARYATTTTQGTLAGVTAPTHGGVAPDAANGALGASASKPARPRKAKADGVPDEPDKTRYLDAFRAAFASPAADFTKDGLFAWRQLRVKHGIDVLLASVAGCAADPWTRANRGLEWVCSQAGVERGTRAPVAAPATDRYGKPDPTANVPRPALFVAPPPLTEEQKAASRAAMEKAKAERRIA